jgi:release factor glutamine methyltransferase
MPGLDVTQPGVPHTVASATRIMTGQLRRAGIEAAGGDVRRLIAGVLGVSAADILRMPERVLSSAQLQLLQAHVARRVRREPVSSILGERDFFGRAFTISPATLDPRPDSETLVAAALDFAHEEGWASQPLRILDVGTGSGCLLVTLLCELPLATGLGSDISDAALEFAARNAARHGVGRRAAWVQTDGLESIAGPFHILVANPPYVRTAEIDGLEPEVRNFDPLEALDGGADGLVIYRRLMHRIGQVVPGGWIVFEVGHDQADAVTVLLSAAIPDLEASRIRIRRDVSGKRRCVAARTLG